MFILLINFLRVQKYGDSGRWTNFLRTLVWSCGDTIRNLRQSGGETAESCRKSSLWGKKKRASRLAFLCVRECVWISPSRYVFYMQGGRLLAYLFHHHRGLYQILFCCHNFIFSKYFPFFMIGDLMTNQRSMLTGLPV